MNDRLYRSRDDRMLAGVAGGLAEYWDADPSLIRIVWALLMIFTGGIALVAYIVMAIVVPEDPSAFVYPTGGGAPAAVPPTADWQSQHAASRAAARAARREARAQRRASGPHTGSLIVGAVLVLVGAWFLLEEFVPAFNADLFWPIALVGLGALILVMAVRPGLESSPPAGPLPPASWPSASPGAGPAGDAGAGSGPEPANPANPANPAVQAAPKP
jgi:phage shock protein C